MKLDYNIDSAKVFKKFLQENKLEEKEHYTFSEIEDIFILARDRFMQDNTLSEIEFSNM